MKQAGSEYLQEEARLRGARPRVKAVVFPFDLDYGLTPGSGVFEHTVYGGEPGTLAMAAGCQATGSWTSPVMPAFAPHLDSMVPSWEGGGGMEAQVFLRSGASPGEVTATPYQSLRQGEEIALAPYYQVRVEFRQTIRSWAEDFAEEAGEFTAYAVNQAPDGGYESYAVEGASSGYVAALRLDGRLAVPESEILDAGAVRVEMARDFGELRAGDHTLSLDNRRGQWLAGAAASYLGGLDWSKKQVALYHGWELEDGRVSWQLLYQGELQSLGGLSHGWRETHRALLKSQDAAAAGLRRLVGVPDAAGVRRPFMRGPYRARAELTETIPASVSTPVMTGSGSATLTVLGEFRSTYPQDYLIEIDGAGEVGSATFRWSLNQGQSWKDTGVRTTGPEDPAELGDGLAVCWEPGLGQDLAPGDHWTFSATPPIYHYQLYGAPFEEIRGVYLNGELTGDRVAADPVTGLIQVTGRSAGVTAAVVKDRTTHPVDIITDILAEVGLSQALDGDSFALAKSLTPEYAIGVCFENVSAAQAVREIVRRCLYDLWIDFGEIKIRAYLGE